MLRAHLRHLGFAVIAVREPRLILEQEGHGPPIVLDVDQTYTEPAIRDWLHHAGIAEATYLRLRAELCPPE